MCVVLAVWNVGLLVDACIGLASSSEVWEYELEYNTRGLSLFQLLLHLYLAALLGLGLLAHSSRDVQRARWFLWGLVAFVQMQLVFHITRVATIEQDAQVYRQQRCAHCMELLKADTCDAVQACTEYDVVWFASQSCPENSFRRSQQSSLQVQVLGVRGRFSIHSFDLACEHLHLSLGPFFLASPRG